jgi:hypothetical protein
MDDALNVYLKSIDDTIVLDDTLRTVLQHWRLTDPDNGMFNGTFRSIEIYQSEYFMVISTVDEFGVVHRGTRGSPLERICYEEYHPKNGANVVFRIAETGELLGINIDEDDVFFRGIPVDELPSSVTNSMGPTPSGDA